MFLTLKHFTFFNFLIFTLVSIDDSTRILTFLKDRYDSKQINDINITIKQVLENTKMYIYVSLY